MTHPLCSSCIVGGTTDTVDKLRRHGVPKEEVANEVYHMIFGMLNEELVSRGFVQMPDFHVGEGRYLKSIELYNNESSTC